MEVCRLCGGPVAERFRARVLSRYQAAYQECAACGSLQTERPYWLEEAYAALDETPDVGAARRNVMISSLVSSVLRGAGITPEDVCLDWGAGRGLFCRLMRDNGFNFLAYDKYAGCEYVPTYRVESPGLIQPRVLTAFEVFEHLADPGAELAAFFRSEPEIVLISTELYEGQQSDWWYLDPTTGQHVFFYSRRGLEWIAARFGYRLLQLYPAWGFVRGDCELGEGPWLAAGLQQLSQDLLTDPWRWVFRDYEEVIRRRGLDSGSPKC